ncbi:MAG TPA: Gldg family protein [Spirochaetia bacterium]|nr:Gldg family protein [Spirochaetia bacterium]
MKKNPILESLSSKKVRYGGYATLLVLGALAVVIVINVLVDQVPGKLDLTKNKIYTLAPETYKLLDSLKSDVTVTTIGKQGSEDPTVKALLAKYASHGGHVKLATVDPDLNPGWAKQFDTTGQGLGAGSLVVASGKKFKTIGQYDMYNYDTSNYDPTNPNSAPRLTSLSIEQRVTSAIQYVTAAKNVTIYQLTGHGESTLASLGLTTAVGNENYEVKDLNLLTDKTVPAGADIVLVMAPKKDISAEDADKLRAYLAGGGRMVVLLDVITAANPTPNLAGLLATYGVEVRNVVVVEGDTNKVAAQNPLFIIPNLEYHDILSPLRTNNYDMVLIGAQAIKTLDLKKRTLKIEPLLTSSPRSYGKVDIANAKSVDRAPQDIPGPFDLAVAITDPAQDAGGQDTRLVVVGNVKFLQGGMPGQVPGNGDFFMNSIGWLRGQKDSITIRPKDVSQMRLSMSQLEALLFSGLVVVILPLLILGSGLVVWLRRRHL